MRTVGIVVLLILLTLGYFVWDGFIPRKLTPASFSGSAQIVTWEQIEFPLFPIDPARKYIAVYVENPTDYVVRQISIIAQIKVGSNVTISVPSTDCLAKSKPDLRILAHVKAERQTCVAPLTGQQSELIPERELFGSKLVDRQGLEFSWSYSAVWGHGQPIKVLSDAADWFDSLLVRLKQPFERVNK
jgi:hypothetical protein